MRFLPINPIIVIPSRMGSTRLPGKPLADINGEPMIVHVWRKAIESDVGPVVVACEDTEISDAIQSVGGETIIVREECSTGTDRISKAIEIMDHDNSHDAVINVQGDMPTLDPDCIRKSFDLLENITVDIGTSACVITNEDDVKDPGVVKSIVSISDENDRGRALYFTRSVAPYGDGPLYHHIGVYAFRRHALERFCSFSPSPLETRESLEQLRALENGMIMSVAIVDTSYISVDTQADLDKVRSLF